MFGLVFNTAKAAACLAVTPLAVVADVLTLPASAERGAAPFAKTAALVRRASACFSAATCPHDELADGQLVDLGLRKRFTCTRCGTRLIF